MESKAGFFFVAQMKLSMQMVRNAFLNLVMFRVIGLIPWAFVCLVGDV